MPGRHSLVDNFCGAVEWSGPLSESAAGTHSHFRCIWHLGVWGLHVHSRIGPVVSNPMAQFVSLSEHCSEGTAPNCHRGSDLGQQLERNCCFNLIGQPGSSVLSIISVSARPSPRTPITVPVFSKLTMSLNTRPGTLRVVVILQQTHSHTTK